VGVPRLKGGLFMLGNARYRHVLTVGAAAVALFAAPAAGAGLTPAAGATTVSNWVISSRAISLINSYTGSGTLTTNAFDVASTDEIGAPARGWVAQRTTSYTFYGPVSKPGSFLYALKHKTVPAGTSYVMLDMESWANTPHSEQVTPKVYLREFVAAAHKNGYRAILAPSVNLTTGMTCNQASDPAWQNYLVNCSVPTIVAQAHPEVYEVQSQRYEASTGAGSDCGCYKWFTTQAAGQARGVVGGLDVRAGLSTNPSGKVSTGQTLYADTLNTQATVNGYWLNVPQQGTSCPSCQPDGAPQVAVSYLRLLGYQD
jgi:hypothetical protein